MERGPRGRAEAADRGPAHGAAPSRARRRAAGFADRQAEAVAKAVRDGRADLATKADLANAIAGLEARLETKIEQAINGLTWRMFVIGGLIVAAVKDESGFRTCETGIDRYADIADFSDLPSHRIFDRIAEHFEEEGRGKIADAIIRLFAQPRNSRRPVQHARNSPLRIERRKRDRHGHQQFHVHAWHPRSIGGGYGEFHRLPAAQHVREKVAVHAVARQKRHKLRRAPAGEIRRGNLVQVGTQFAIKNMPFVEPKRRAFSIPDSRIGIEIQESGVASHGLHPDKRQVGRQRIAGPDVAAVHLAKFRQRRGAQGRPVHRSPAAAGDPNIPSAASAPTMAAPWTSSAR